MHSAARSVPELECKQLSAGWGQTQVLDQVSLQVQAGETVVILGRNGVGKTTLLSALMGRAAWKSGSIMLGGRPIEHLPMYTRSDLGLGFVPQEREIFPSLSVLENLTVAARPRGWTLDRVFDLFPALKERRHNRGTQLSGGEQQMLSIGRALVGGPSVLLMDEPLEGLAPVVVELVVEAIHRLRQESDMAILLVEQHVDIALEFSSRVVVLDRGSVVYHNLESGAPVDRVAIESMVGISG